MSAPNIPSSTHISNLISTELPDNADIEEPRFRMEYAIWKKNAPYLYDMIFTTRLPWPSLTVEWLPEVEFVNTSSSHQTTQNTSNLKNTDTVLTRYKFLLGTQTSGHAYEYVRIGTIDLPNLDCISKTSSLSLLNKYDQVLGEFGGYQSSRSQFKIHQYLNHTGEVNRARYMPQNPSIVATGSSDGFVYLFDCTKHPLDPRTSVAGANTAATVTLAANEIASSTSQASSWNENGINANLSKSLGIPRSRPDMILQSHATEVSSLSWNQFKHGVLASGSFDKTVAIWNIKSWTNGTHLSPDSVLKTHSDIVNDLEWHKFNPAMLGSVSDDGEIHIHDTRLKEATTKALLSSAPLRYLEGQDKAHDIIGLNSISFNPANEDLVATGGTDGNVTLWDLRSLNSPIHIMHGHADNINAVEWSPHDPVVLASASSDRRVCIWDISRIGDDDSQEARDINNVQSAADTIGTEITPSPELLWVHGGHTESVSDVAWNPALPWVLASVSNDNHTHIFKPAQSIVGRRS